MKGRFYHNWYAFFDDHAIFLTFLHDVLIYSALQLLNSQKALSYDTRAKCFSRFQRLQKV